MLAVFFVTAVLSYTDRFILSLLVDPLRADLHINDTDVSLLQGLAFAVVYGVAGLPLGRVADTLARRNLIIGGVTVWSAATIACGFARSFPELFAARIAIGIGEAALAPAAVSMIADCFPPARRGTAISIFIAGMAIGGGAAIAIGGFLAGAASSGTFSTWPVIGHLAPWRTTLVLLGVCGVAVIGLLLTLREPPRRGLIGQVPSSRISLAQAAAAFRSRAPLLVPLYLAVALISAGDFSFQNWTPALLSRRFGLTPLQIGERLGLLAMITGVCGTLFGGILGDYRFRKGGDAARLGVALVAIVLGLGGSAIALAADPAWTLVCFALWTSMASAAEAIGIAVIQAIVPGEVRGVGVSLVSLSNMIIGLSCGTTLTAVLTDHVFRDPAAVGLSMAAVVIPTALAALALFWTVRRATAVIRNAP